MSLAMSGMLLFIRFLEGPYVLRKAQIIDTVRMKKNSLKGKVSGVGMPTNILLCTEMLHPTQVPIRTPEKEPEMTRMKAS